MSKQLRNNSPLFVNVLQSSNDLRLNEDDLGASQDSQVDRRKILVDDLTAARLGSSQDCITAEKSALADVPGTGASRAR